MRKPTLCRSHHRDGVTIATVGYRLAPAHTFPACFDDCMAAFELIMTVVGRHGGSPDSAFVTGHSAGGHLATLLALRLGSRRLRGCLPLSGVYDLTESGGLSSRPRFLGPQRTEEAASPILLIDERPIPMLVASSVL